MTAQISRFLWDPGDLVIVPAEPAPPPPPLSDAEPFGPPTGTELFLSKTEAEQDAAVGPEAAQLIREGRADLKDFVSHSKQSEQDDFITQKPVQDV